MRLNADILKIGAAVVDRGTILLVRKRGTQVYILPGGKPEGTESDEEALRREIAEELGTAVVVTKHTFLGEFADVSADGSGRRVVVRLYFAELDGTPSPQSEIEEIVWFGEGSDSLRLAPSLTNFIIPFLTAAGHVR